MKKLILILLFFVFISSVYAYNTDNTITLLFFVNGSLNGLNWFFWCPSEEQFNLFPLLTEIYNFVEMHNKKNREVIKK